jgi:hypothetical protein
VNTQEKFITQLRRTLPRRFELIHDSHMANTGTLRVQRLGQFADVVTLRYDFQASYVNFVLRGTGEMVLLVDGRCTRVLEDKFTVPFYALGDVITRVRNMLPPLTEEEKAE